MKYKVLFVFITVLFFTFTGCDKEDNSNPSTPEAPATVGVYSGNNSMDTTMTITVSNLAGTAFVTAYNINFKTSSGEQGTYAQSSSSGFVEVTSNTFQISVGSEADEVLQGSINGSTMSGSFKFPSNPLTPVVTGTFTLTKN